GDVVPADGAEHARQDDGEAVHADGEFDQAVGDGLGDLAAEVGADEVADGGHGQCGAGFERPGGDGGGDRVGRVVEAVGEGEQQGRADDHDHRYEVGVQGQDSLT